MHPYGYAVDLRTYYFKDNGEDAFHQLFLELENYGYDVVFEKDHIHVEHDEFVHNLEAWMDGLVGEND
jgi:hypothetical protein